MTNKELKPASLAFSRPAEPCWKCGEEAYIVLPVKLESKLAADVGNVYIKCISCGQRGALNLLYWHSVDYEAKRRIWRELVRQWNHAAKQSRKETKGAKQ